MELSTYVKVYPDRSDPDSALLYSTLRGAVLRVSSSLVDALMAGTLESEEEEQLARLGILVADAGAEKRQVAGYFDWANDATTRSSVLVTLNLDCNLACSYCYEQHFREQRYMSNATADLLVATLVNGPLAAGKELQLDFYGGEALLSLPLLKRVAGQLQAAAAERGSLFSFAIITNGVLLSRQLVTELLSLGLTAVRLTLDGPPEVHDCQRPFVSGRGSFARILANLRDVCDLVEVQLGGNFTRDNYRRFPELLDILVAAGITPDKLSVVQFFPVMPSAGEAGMGDFAQGCACSSEPWLIEATLYLREEILKRGWDTPKPKLTGCTVEFTNDLVVGWDGSLYKCPAFMGWDDLRIGSLSEGVGDYRDSHNLAVWHCDECLDCAYLPLCFGGCRFLRRLRTGAIDGVDCRREFFDAALERFVRQDIDLRR